MFSRECREFEAAAVRAPVSIISIYLDEFPYETRFPRAS